MKKYAALLLWVCALLAPAAQAQVCAAPGKDAPGTIGGVINRYHVGNGNRAVGNTTLTLGAASGAADAVAVGDVLLIIQMQAVTLNTSNDERYGDGVGTTNSRPGSSISQSNGYTALNNAGAYQFLRVTAAAGNNITFTPALTSAYTQNAGSTTRRTYQVIRVPQYPSITIDGANPVTPLPWNGLVGGVVAMDVAGRLTFTGAGPHVEASNRGFRGGVQGVNNSEFPSGTLLYRGTDTVDGGSKGEGIGGTPQYVQTSVAGGYNSGTRFSDGAPTFVNNGAAGGYPNGDFLRGAPANAGGGGNSHNAAGGGGGNGGAGGNGGQTYNGDGLLDTGGYGGSRAPQTGVLLATNIFMGGGGGSGSLNDGTSPRGAGGNGGGIIMVRAGSFSGPGILRADGQRGWDSNVSNDAGGGGGAGGSVLLIAGSGHGNVTVQARGGDGADSNLNNTNTSIPSPTGVQGNCCGGEREGPGGGGGGGAVYANAAPGALDLAGGINGKSREDLFLGFSGNMQANPGGAGTSDVTFASSSTPGVLPGYECLPVLTVSKLTTTPARTVPPDTTAAYRIRVDNAATSGIAYGVSLGDTLPPPFTLSGTTAVVTYGAGASGPASPLTVTGTSTLVMGAPGNPTTGFTLDSGAGLTLSFNVSLNAATSGTYNNPAAADYTDPTRLSGVAALAGTNVTASPASADAIGNVAGGSNYAAGASTQEDVVIAGAPPVTAELALAKTGPATADTGGPVQYVLTLSNAGPANLAGSTTVNDIVPAAIGSVTWVCTVTSGSADCDTAGAGTGGAGSGNTVTLPRIQIASGAEIRIQIDGTALSAGTITNTATATITPGFTDPSTANNTATATTVISVPVADLSITKTNDVGTVTAGGVTAYQISVVNPGPSAADGTTVTDPAATGLTKLSVNCSSSGGAICPGGLSTATFQAGVQIPTLPAGGSVTFELNAQVTAGSGSVVNTAAISPPPALNDANPANNSASDTDAVGVANTTVVTAAGICPAGTTEQPVNLVVNGDFADTGAALGAAISQYPLNTNVPDTGVGIQSGARNYGGLTVQNPFPGDVSRSVAGANTWLYHNGNDTGAAYRYWSQTVNGLQVGRTYTWLYYGSNAIVPGNVAANALPSIQFRLTAGPSTQVLGGTDVYALETLGTGDAWTLRQRNFTASVTSVVLALWDTRTGSTNGDAFGSAQVTLRECTPNADPVVTKTDNTTTVVTLSTTTYIVTVANNGPGPADGVVLKDPADPGLSKIDISCQATGVGALCPVSTTVSGVEGAGLTIPALPAGTTVTFTITASVTALQGQVTGTAELQLPPGLVDSNLLNNDAEDVDNVQGLANVSIAKTNNTTTIASGATSTYLITVGNAGPSPADNSVLRDPAAAGLSCTTAAACAASGGAACGGATIPIASLQVGYPIPSLPSGGQVTVTVACGVTATGQ